MVHAVEHVQSALTHSWRLTIVITRVISHLESLQVDLMDTQDSEHKSRTTGHGCIT